MTSSMTSSHPLIVAIDGPSGVGKSTAARRLAGRLGVPFLDTGAMYRAIGLKVLESGFDPHDRDAVVAHRGRGRRAPGPPRGRQLRGPPRRRARRVPHPHSRGGGGDLGHLRLSRGPPAHGRACSARPPASSARVLEGRDIGTRVFPDTPHKFFLDARSDVRFQRRFEELAAAGRSVTFDQVVAEISRRDQRDSTRADSPLTRDGSYTFVDTSDLTIDEVVEQMARADR